MTTSPSPEAPSVATGVDGNLLGVLAASMPGHSVLYLGRMPRGAVAAGLLGAMDITSKLLVVTDTEATAATLREEIPGDLRLSVHTQALAPFLADVAHHVFGLVLLERDVPAPIAASASALVAPGGLAVALSSDVPAPEPSADWVLWNGAGALTGGWIGARRARPAARRRGGRVARQARDAGLQGERTNP